MCRARKQHLLQSERTQAFGTIGVGWISEPGPRDRTRERSDSLRWAAGGQIELR